MSGSDDAVAECIARERELLRPAVRSSNDALDRLLDPEFEEIGASGRRWSRAAIIEAMASSAPGFNDTDPIRDEDMEGRRLSDHLVLLTYVSDASGRRAWRTSLWRRSEGSWRLLHHQGTPLA